MLHFLQKAKDVVSAGFNRVKKVAVAGALVAATAIGSVVAAPSAAAHAAVLDSVPASAFLTDPTPAAGISDLGISSLVTELVSVVQTIIGLLTKFPLNIFLAATIIFMGVRLFKSLKRG